MRASRIEDSIKADREVRLRLGSDLKQMCVCVCVHVCMFSHACHPGDRRSFL